MKEVKDVDAAAIAAIVIDEVQKKLPAAPPETVKLSASVAKVLLAKTPMHAWQYHRLLGGGKSKSTEATEDGNIYESLIFGNAAEKLAVLNYPNFQSNEAKKAKAEAIAAGKIPVKTSDFTEMSDAAIQMLKGINEAGVFFEGGIYQEEIVWVSPEGVECKAVLDYPVYGADFYIINDLKCVEDAGPDKMTRSIVDYGWDIQAAAYIEAIETKHPELAGRGLYRLVCCEKTAPYAVNIISLSGMFLELGRRKWARAKALWAPCLRDNVWPGYPATTVTPLPWQMTKEEEAGA